MTIRSESIDRLFRTFLNLGSIEECYAYFEDLCTVNEIRDMAQRLDAAILLSKGMSYNEIKEQVDISSGTISRVNRCLNYGSNGYASAIEKLEAKEKEE